MRNFLKFSIVGFLTLLLLPLQIDAEPQEFDKTDKEQVSECHFLDIGQMFTGVNKDVFVVVFQKHSNVSSATTKSVTGQKSGYFEQDKYKALFFGAGCGGVGRISRSPKTKSYSKAVLNTGTGSGGLEGRRG